MRKTLTSRSEAHAIEDDEAYIREPAVKALVNATNLPALTHLQLR